MFEIGAGSSPDEGSGFRRHQCLGPLDGALSGRSCRHSVEPPREVGQAIEGDVGELAPPHPSEVRDVSNGVVVSCGVLVASQHSVEQSNGAICLALEPVDCQRQLLARILLEEPGLAECWRRSPMRGRTTARTPVLGPCRSPAAASRGARRDTPRWPRIRSRCRRPQEVRRRSVQAPSHWGCVPDGRPPSAHPCGR